MNVSRYLILVIVAPLFLQGCKHEASNYLKGEIIGTWEEVHGTHEVLQFNSDGSLIMNSPSEHHNCKYDFPDATHIQLDCSLAGSPPSPRLWEVSLSTDGKLSIGIGRDVGTYKRQ